MSNHEVYLAIQNAINTKEAGFIATVVDIDRSAPTLIGSKMLIYPSGAIVGTIGGGEIEYTVIQRCIAGQYPVTQVCQFNLTPDVGHETANLSHAEHLSMVCGGVMKILIEPLLSLNHLIIVGAGHCAIALAQMAKMIDFQVTVVDDRIEWANKERHKHADHVLCMPFENMANQFQTHLNTYIVIMTNGHKNDETVLQQFINKPHKYLGVIGSKSKVLTVFHRLENEGFSLEKLKTVFSPIGLDLGTKAPSEIAISILAQILAIKNNKTQLELSSNPLSKT